MSEKKSEKHFKGSRDDSNVYFGNAIILLQFPYVRYTYGCHVQFCGGWSCDHIIFNAIENCVIYKNTNKNSV